MSSTNLMWICICPVSTARRVNEGVITPIYPKDKCPSCGHTYDQVNAVAWEENYR